MKNVTYISTEFGKVGIAEDEIGITDVFFKSEEPQKNLQENETPLLKEAAMQLLEYFAGSRKEFDFPLSMSGTEFQVAVWKALQTIPYGETYSYKKIAEQIGNPKACRAVGMANHKNPICIIVPCHRVIGHNGKLVGYGSGLKMKEKLLKLEGAI